jgi:hypothetical protein
MKLADFEKSLHDCRKTLLEVRHLVAEIAQFTTEILIIGFGFIDAWRFLCRH